MVWLFLPKWVICVWGDDVRSSVKEHKVKTVLNFTYCKTPHLMLFSVECLSYILLQCSQLRYSFFQPLGNPILLLVVRTYGSMFSFSTKNHGKSSAAEDMWELTLFILEKKMIVSNVTQNS